MINLVDETAEKSISKEKKTPVGVERVAQGGLVQGRLIGWEPEPDNLLAKRLSEDEAEAAVGLTPTTLLAGGSTGPKAAARQPQQASC